MRLYLPLTHLYQGVDLDPLPSSFPCAATMASGTISATWPLPEICSHSISIKTSSARETSLVQNCAQRSEPGNHGVADGDQEGQGEGEGDPPSHGVSPRPPPPPLPASRFRRARSIPSGLSPPRLPPTCQRRWLRVVALTSLTRACPCALDLLVSFLRARPLAAWTTPARRRS